MEYGNLDNSKKGWSITAFTNLDYKARIKENDKFQVVSMQDVSFDEQKILGYQDFKVVDTVNQENLQVLDLEKYYFSICRTILILIQQRSFQHYVDSNFQEVH